jgi:hypothetical protein
MKLHTGIELRKGDRRIDNTVEEVALCFVCLCPATDVRPKTTICLGAKK